MRTAVLVAVIAAVPPTLGAVLTFLQARAANRRAKEQETVGLARSLAELRSSNPLVTDDLQVNAATYSPTSATPRCGPRPQGPPAL
jgi:hypothetical protein